MRKPLLAAAVAVVVAIAVSPAPSVASTASRTVVASSGPVNLIPSGDLFGYDGVLNGGAATIEGFLDEAGGLVRAICVQYGVPMDRGMHVAIRPSESQRLGVPKAIWIGQNHGNIGIPLENEHAEASAVQVAAWVYTNGVDVNLDTVPAPVVMDRIMELVEGAETVDVNSRTRFDLTLDVRRDGLTIAGNVHLTTDDGLPLDGESISISVNGKVHLTVVTGADGMATVRQQLPAGPVTATWTGSIPGGTLIQPVNGGQVFVTLDSAAVIREAIFDPGSEIGAASDWDTPVKTLWAKVITPFVEVWEFIGIVAIVIGFVRRQKLREYLGRVG
jgi:hypothetical protein